MNVIKLTEKRRAALQRVADHPGALRVADLIVNRYNPCPWLVLQGLLTWARDADDNITGYVLTDAGHAALRESI